MTQLIAFDTKTRNQIVFWNLFHLFARASFQTQKTNIRSALVSSVNVVHVTQFTFVFPMSFELEHTVN